MQFCSIQFSTRSVQRLISIVLVTTSLLGGCAYNTKDFMGNKKFETTLPPYEKLIISGDHSEDESINQIIEHELNQNIFNPKTTADTSPHQFNIEFIVDEDNIPLTFLGCISVLPALCLLPTPDKRVITAKILFTDLSGNLLAMFTGRGRGTSIHTMPLNALPPNELYRGQKIAFSKALVMSIKEIKNKIQSSQAELLTILKAQHGK